MQPVNVKSVLDNMEGTYQHLGFAVNLPRIVPRQNGNISHDFAISLVTNEISIESAKEELVLNNYFDQCY